MIIKIVRDWKLHDVWNVRDETGQVVRLKLRPKSLPNNVMKAVQPSARAYFHAEMRDGSLIFGHRVAGDPQW